MAASSFCASKYDVPFGNRYERTSAAAAENVEWPDVYDGKFGRPITVRIDGSSCDGRGLNEVNFASQHPTAASCIAMFSSANVRAARTSLNRASRTYGAAMKSQWPGGVGVLTPSAHL